MRSLKTIIAVALLSFYATASMAQTEPTYEFKKHAFITLQGGAQYTLGEAKFKDLISPNAQFSIGYQFSPVFAARLQGNAWQSKGGWNGYKTNTTEEPYTNDYKFKYVAPGVDFMFNLSNLFCGWNPKRVFNLTAFLGGGANIAWDNDEVNEIGAQFRNNLGAYELEYLWDGTKVRAFGRGGLEASFRLSDAVRFIIEGNANILSDHYNSKKAENPDWYFNALAGFRINLGKTYKEIVPVVLPIPEPVEEYVEPAPAPAPPAPVVEKVEPLRRDVFFIINKTNIQEKEAHKVAEVAEYLKKYPDAKVSVTGYADAGTGNDRINDRLAAGRAATVVKALQEQYGISADRITSDSKGARVQPFAENDLNRVSICIAE